MEYLTIDDLKNEARKKVPKAFHDYGFVNSGYSVNGIPHVSDIG